MHPNQPEALTNLVTAAHQAWNIANESVLVALVIVLPIVIAILILIERPKPTQL